MKCLCDSVDNAHKQVWLLVTDLYLPTLKDFNHIRCVYNRRLSYYDAIIVKVHTLSKLHNTARILFRPFELLKYGVDLNIEIIIHHLFHYCHYYLCIHSC